MRLGLLLLVCFLFKSVSFPFRNEPFGFNFLLLLERSVLVVLATCYNLNFLCFSKKEKKKNNGKKQKRKPNPSSYSSTLFHPSKRTKVN